MHLADLHHHDKTLQAKLEKLYRLNRHKTIDLSFRPPYLELLKAFGNPQDHLPPIIHVAGTNGKGSIIALLRAILEAQGYSVHAYTSPHLLEFNERIVLAGEKIANDTLESLIDEAMHYNENREITFFEITTAIAFAAFARNPADILLLEVGMGGRLDCTNIISKPYVSIINMISYDHMEYLGNTLGEIAREKAGIIKYETPCIVGYQMKKPGNKRPENPVDSIVDCARDKNAPLYCAAQQWSCEPDGPEMIFTMNGQKEIYPRPTLPGNHQIQNAGAALAALETIKESFPVDRIAIESGLQNVKWPGRLQRIQHGRCADALKPSQELWYDGGHNDSAGQALGHHMAQWNADDPKTLHLIIGMKAEKNPETFLNPLLPYIKSCTVIPLEGVGPCLQVNQIQSTLNKHGIETIQQKDIKTAIMQITTKTNEPLRILVCGSLYLAGQLAHEGRK